MRNRTQAHQHSKFLTALDAQVEAQVKEAVDKAKADAVKQEISTLREHVKAMSQAARDQLRATIDEDLADQAKYSYDAGNKDRHMSFVSPQREQGLFTKTKSMLGLSTF